MNIFLAAHYNLNNGDRALLEATIRIIEKTVPGCLITVSAYKPDLLNDSRFTTVNWALRNGRYERFMLKLSDYKVFRTLFRKFYSIICDPHYLSAIKEADIVLVSGGHHLTDILSNRGYYKLSSNFIVPIMMRKKVILLPQSIGPATDPEVVDSIKLILSKSYSVAYRDNSSKLFLDSLEINCTKQYVPDLVYSLIPNEPYIAKPKTVGIALYHSYAGENRNIILPYTISNLIKVIDHLLDQEYMVQIIPMDNKDEEVYDYILERLINKKKNKHFTITDRGKNIVDLIEKFKGLHFVLAYKTHSTVFSMICNTPLIAIAYHPKSREFLENVSLGEYVIDDKEASYDNLTAMIDHLEKNIDSVKELELTGVRKNRSIIDNYIKEIMRCQL